MIRSVAAEIRWMTVGTGTKASETLIYNCQWGEHSQDSRCVAIRKGADSLHPQRMTRNQGLPQVTFSTLADPLKVGDNRLQAPATTVCRSAFASARSCELGRARVTFFALRLLLALRPSTP